MALLKCPDCKKEISDSAPACPHCGRPKETSSGNIPTKKTKRTGKLFLFLLLLLLLTQIMSSNENSNNQYSSKNKDSNVSKNNACKNVKLLNDYENILSGYVRDIDTHRLAQRFAGIVNNTNSFYSANKHINEIYVKFQNDNSYGVKDVSYSCNIYGLSGTPLKTVKGVEHIYIMKKSSETRKLNLGFKSDDHGIIKCECTGLKRA